MKQIKPVTMFPCPLTGKLFKTAKAAQKSAEEAQKALDATKELERLAAISKANQENNSNFIRLNLADIKDLGRMLTEKAKEFYGFTISDLKIDIGFGQVSNSHGAPIGKKTNWSGGNKNEPTSYLGWSGQIKATVQRVNPVGKNFSDSINNHLFGGYGIGFKGFHTSSGCGGSFNKYAMDIGFYLFLEDFPLLAAKHELFLTEKEKFLKNKSNLASANHAAENFAASHPMVVALNKEISALQTKRENLTMDFFNESLKLNPATVVAQCTEWDFLKTQFGSRWGNSWLHED